MKVAQNGNFPLAVEVTNVAMTLGEVDADTDSQEKRTPVGP